MLEFQSTPAPYSSLASINVCFLLVYFPSSSIFIRNTLLEYDVTRRDPLSVVMDAGSRIVTFIRDGTLSSHNSENNIQHWCACAVVPREPASMTTERK